MKNTIKIVGIIALFAVIGFSFAACDESGKGDGGGSVTYTGTYTAVTGTLVTYTLKITKGAERYTAKSGDDYELTSGSSKSAGTVKSVDGDKLTLTPEKNSALSFNATVSEKGLNELTGLITWSNGDREIAPGALEATGTSSGSGSSGGGGGSLNLTGQVYTMEMNMPTSSSGSFSLFKYESYKGDKTLTSNVGGTGSIKNGKLTFSVGAPSASMLTPAKMIEFPSDENIPADLSNIYSDAKCTPADVKFVPLEIQGLEKFNFNVTANSGTGSGSGTIELVFHIYYDKACKLTATGGKVKQESITMTVPNLNLSMKQGWNTINMKATFNTTSSGTGTVSFSMKTGDSSTCKWVVGGIMGDSDDD